MKGRVLSWFITIGEGRAGRGRTTFAAHDGECKARFSTPVRKPLLVALRALALVGIVGFAASEAAGGACDWSVFSGSGKWSVSGSWNPQSVPGDDSDVYVSFATSSVTGDRTVDIDSSTTKRVGLLVFYNNNGYKTTLDGESGHTLLFKKPDSEYARRVWIKSTGTSWFKNLTLAFLYNSSTSANRSQVVMAGKNIGFENVTVNTSSGYVPPKLTYYNQQGTENENLTFKDSVMTIDDWYSSNNSKTRNVAINNSLLTVKSMSNKATAESTVTSGWTDKMAYTVTLGSKNTSSSAALTVQNTMTVASGSTLTIDANGKGVGTYKILSAGTLTGAGNLTCSLKNGSTSLISGKTVTALATAQTVTSGTKKYTLSSSDSKSVTLTIENTVSYNITYDYAFGTKGSNNPATATYDTAFYVSAPTRTGYKFTGWTVTSGLDTSTAKWGTSASPSTAISSSSTKCVNGESGNVYFKNLTSTDGATVKLTATWEAKTYTVTLTVNGGTINSGNVSSYTYGTGATLPTDVTKSGKVFAGWYADSGFSGSAVTSIGTTATGNKTYYAKWNDTFEQATVTVQEPTVVRFTGEKFAPVVTVTLNGQDITDQCQFSWGGDMINAGLYTLTVRGEPGSEYDGKTLDAHPIFQILPLRSTDYGSWGYTYWYRDGGYRYYVTAYTNAPLSQTANTYHPLKPYCLWQAPTGVTSVEILAVGGAGGGSGGSGSQVGGGGKGGSVYRSESVTVTAGAYYEVRLGKGGAGGAANGAGGNGEVTYLYAGAVSKTGTWAPASESYPKGYEYEEWTRNPTTAKLSAAGGTGALAASGAAGANGTNAGSYDILITGRNYGYGGAKGSGTAAGAAGADIYGQGGAGGGKNAVGGKGGDGTLIIRYKVAEQTRTQWKQNVQSGDWNTAANWVGGKTPTSNNGSQGAEFYMLDGATEVTVNSAATTPHLSVNNMAPLTLKINNKLTVGSWTDNEYPQIGTSGFRLPMTTLEFANSSSQLNLKPPIDAFGLHIGAGGADAMTATLRFKIPASGWTTKETAPLYDGISQSPVTIGSSCLVEIDATDMTATGIANKRCLCYAAGGMRVTAGLNYNFLSLNQWLASGRVQMTVPAGKRGVIVWQDASGNVMDANTVDSADGGIWFYLADAVDIKNAVVTISKTTAGFTGSPVGAPEVTSVTLNGTDITASCMLVGWKDENGNTVEGSQLTTWGTYTPIVQAKPEQSDYGGTVDNATLPTFEILAVYYHKPGVPAWATTSGWFLDEALTDGVNVYPDNENVQVNVFAGSAANVVGKDSGAVASAKVKTVALRGNASDASKYAALAQMTLDVKLEKSRAVVVAERGTSYLSNIDLIIAAGSDGSAVAYADVQPGATLGIDNVSIGRMVVNMSADSTLKLLSKGLAGSGTSSTLGAFRGDGAGTRTLAVENNTATFSGASGVSGKLDLQLTPGANNTTANTMLTISGAFTAGSGSTLKVDASAKTTAGTYPLVRATSFGGMTAAQLAGAATVTTQPSGSKFAKVVATSDGKGLDLVVYNTVAKPTVTTSFTYDGNQKTAGSAATGYSVSGNTGTNADNYTFKATLKSGYCWSDNHSTSDYSVGWKINKANDSVTKPTMAGWKYGESASSPSGSTCTSGTTITYKYYQSNGTTLIGTDRPSTPGTYVVKAHSAGNSNYNAGVSEGASFTISNGTISYTATGYSAAYDGSAHGISVTVTAPSSGATVKYGTTSGTCDKDTSPTRTNVGTTTVYYQITAANYTTVTGSQTIKITRATATEPTAKTGLTYTGASQSGVKTSGSGVTLDGTQSATNAGNYSFTATPDSNHQWSGGGTDAKTYNWSIAKATPTLTAPTASAITYPQFLSSSTLSGGSAKLGSATVAGSFTWTNPSTKPEVSDSQTTAYSVTFTPTDTANFKTATTTVKLTVNKATITIPTAKTGLTYNGSAQTGVNVPSTTVITQSGDNPSQTNAGTYETTYALKWPANYQWSDNSTTDKTVTWSIAKRSISSATTGNCYWTGSVVHPPVNCNGRYLVQGTDYTYTINGESVSPVDVGSYSTVVFTGTGNYEGTFTQATWKINRMTYTWSPTTSGNWDDASWTCAGGDAYRTAAQYLSQISSFPNGAFGHNAIVKKGVTISLGSTPRTLYELQLQGDTIKDGSLAFRTMSLTGTTTFKNVNFTANYLASDHYGEIKPGEGATVVFEGQNASDDAHIRLRSDTINNQTFVFKDGSTVLKGSYTLWRRDDKESHLNANFAITNATVQLASISAMNGSGGYYDLHLFFKPGTVDARTEPLLKVAGAMALSSGATLEVDISDFATTPGVYKLIELGSSLTYGGATCQTFCTAMADNISGKNANYGYALVPATDNKGVNLVVYNPTVTLDNQGATTAGSASVTVTYGADIPKIETPKKTGYAFEGYYAQPGGKGIRYIGSGGDSRHVWDQYDTTTLYANWLKNIDYKRGDYTGAYDGLPHGITLEVIDPADASIKYGTVSGTYDLDEPPTLTEVGTMTVYYKIEKAGYGTVSSSKTITITKGSNTFTAGPTISGWTYGSSPSTPSATPKFGGAITYKYYSDSGCTQEITPSDTMAAGTYYMKATSKGTSNYDAVTSEAVSFTVSRKDISGFTTGVPAYGVTYTGSPLTPEVSLIWIGHSDPVKGRDYTVEFSNNINVGDATVKFTGLGNYTGEKTATFKINKATIDKVPSQTGTLTYTGSKQTPEVNAPAKTTAGSQTITWTYSATSGGSYSSTVPQVGPNAGTHTIYYKATAANHNEKTGSFTVTIGQASITEATASSKTYTGSVQTPSVTVKAGTLTLASTDYTLGSWSGTLKDANTYTATVTGKGNYTGSKTVSFTINKATLTATATISANPIVYRDAAPTYGVTVTGFVNGETAETADDYVAPEVSCAYVQATDVTDREGGKAGAYPVTVTGGSAKNYTFAKNNATLTVNKKQLTLPVGHAVEYTGALIDQPNSVSGMIWLVDAARTGTYQETNVGNYSVTFTPYADGCEWKDTGTGEARTVNWSITPATLTVTANANAANVTYGSAAPGYTLAYSGWKGSDGESLITMAPTATTTYTTTSAAGGTYYYTPKGGNALENYSYSYQKGTGFTVGKASVTIPTANNEYPVYDGKRHERVKNKPDPSIATCSAERTDLYGDGSATFQLVDKANYQWSGGSTTSKTVSWTVAPKTLTVKWGSTTSWVYDGNSHVPTCTLEGVCTRDTGTVDVCTPVVSGEQTNVGNYTATVTSLTGAQYGYYKLPASGTTQAFSITKPVYTVNGDKQIEVDPTEMKKLFGNTVSSWQTALTTANANGVPGWEAYVLGMNSADEWQSLTKTMIIEQGAESTPAREHPTFRMSDSAKLAAATKRLVTAGGQPGVSAVKYELVGKTPSGTYAAVSTSELGDEQGNPRSTPAFIYNLSKMNVDVRFFMIRRVYEFANQAQ